MHGQNLRKSEESQLIQLERQLELYDQLNKASGVYHLIVKAAELFSNPVVLLDSKLRLIARADLTAKAQAICPNLSSNGECCSKNINCLRNPDILSRIKQSNRPVYIWEFQASSAARILGKVECEGKIAAYFVVVEENADLSSDSEIELAGVLANVIGIFLNQFKSHLLLFGDAVGGLAIDILDGLYPGRQQIEKRMMYLNLPKGDWYQLLFIPGFQGDHEFLSIEYLSLCFEKAGRKPNILFKDGSYVLLFHVADVIELKGLAYDVSEILSSANLRAGMGERFRQLADLLWQLELCEAIFDFGTKRLADDNLHRLGDNLLPILMSGCFDSNDRRLIHPDIELLHEYDRRNHADLLRTWAVYLKEHKQLGESAKRLKIHKNTLIYRMKKIQEITLGLEQGTDDIFYQLMSIEKVLSRTESHLAQQQK